MANKKKRKSDAHRRPATQEPPPPKKRTGPSRREVQLAAEQKARRRASLRRAGGMSAVVLVALGVVAAVVVLDRRGDAQLRSALTAGGCEVDKQADPTGPAGRNHVPSPSYQVNPPAGGDHLAAAARAGVYTGGSLPDDGLLVHALEHGYVIAWHRPDLPEDQVAKLEDLQRRHDDDVIVAERSDLPVPVAATAWRQRLLCQQVESGPLDRFVGEYVGKGPENVPRG